MLVTSTTPTTVRTVDALQQGVRKLVPIAHFDMVGYSRLIGADDTGTLARIQSLRTTLFDPLIAEHGGAVVQTAGDSLLVLFESILDAVTCAAAIQQRVPGHPANAGQADPIKFRVGVEMGDVIADRGDFHGEGVIVAVRLESACPPGAVCVSRAVFEHVSGRVGARARALGALELKNVARKVEAFVLEFDSFASAPVAVVDRAFSDRAAIAVLPFRSQGPDEDAFTDAMTDDLIDAMAAWRSFPVISRHSSFAFRGREMDARTLGNQLGARYLLSGSVRRRGARARIAVQLDDCETGTTLLRESFERENADTFALQDDAVSAIAGALGPEIQGFERERAIRRLSPQPDVQELFARGMWYRHRNTRADLDAAEQCFRAALERDPRHVPSIAAASIALNFRGISGWSDDEQATYAESLDLARRAVAEGPRYPQAHYALGVACITKRRLEEAASALREAIRFNPSHSYARANLGHLSNYFNRPEEALPEIEIALRLNPHDPNRFIWLAYVAASHYLAGRYETTLRVGQDALIANPEFPHAARYMVAAYGQLGRPKEAKTVLEMVRRVDPTLAALERRTRSLFVAEAADHLLDGFRRGGLA